MPDLPEAPSPSPPRLFRRLVLAVFLGTVLVAISGAAWLGLYVLTPAPESEEATAVVYIPRGASGREIETLLAEQNLVREDPRFLLLARLSGYGSRLQAGEFRLATGRRPLELLEELSRARPLAHLVTVPEGRRLTEIAEIFARDGWTDPEHFVGAASSPELLAELGLEQVGTLEGYLFPDTYQLVRPAVAAPELVRMMVDRALAVWDTMAVQSNSGLSRHQVFTLASIVEKESGVAGERPLVAAVFLNRLRLGMRLQSDPTVIYGLDDFDGNLTRADLRRPTPYNTYTIDGLPPGPICSPGEESLRSVLAPAPVEYLYFVSKNDGTHYFSRTLREHNRAVRKYQRNRTSSASSE